MGDIAEGSKWWSVANFRKQELERQYRANSIKQMLDRHYRANNNFMQSWYQVSPDVKIWCVMRSGTAWAFIFTEAALYMESGFLTIESAQCYEGVARPARLLYNAAVSQYINSVDKPIQGELHLTDNSAEGEKLEDADTVAGYMSKAVGCPDSTKTTEFIDACGVTHESNEPVYCDYTQMVTKKKCQALMPASLFTGKTRLLVQAIYGSKRKDYTCNWEDFDYILRIGSLELHPTYANNTWLLTTDDYDYFIVTFLGGTLSFQKLKTSHNILKQLIQENAGDGDTVKKLEAYLLSTAELDEETPVQVIDIGGDDKSGTPLIYGAYGWHSTQNGRTADTVLMELVGPPTTFSCHHMSMEITYDKDGDEYVFAAVRSHISTGTFSPVGDFIAFLVPILTTGITVNSPIYPPYAGGYTSDAKLHVYYDSADSLQTWGVRRSYTSYPGSQPDEVQQTGRDGTQYDDYLALWRFYSSNGSSDNEVAVMNNGDDVVRAMHNFSGINTYAMKGFLGTEPSGYNPVYGLGSDPLRSDYETGLSISQYMVQQGYFENINGGNGPACEFGEDYSITYRGIYREATYYYHFQELTSTSSNQQTGGLFLEIPINDCEQVWYGENFFTSSGGSSSWWARSMAVDWYVERVHTIYGVSTTYEMIKDIAPFEADRTAWPGAPLVPISDQVDPNPITEKSYIYVTDGTEVYRGDRSLDFHWSAPVDGSDYISAEPWRSNTTGKYYNNLLALGGEFVEYSFDWEGDSVVGWV